MTSPRWLYYKIYPGAAAAGKFDHLIAGALQRTAQLELISNWFFLRYTDEAGPHLRLRLQTYGEVSELRRAADLILNEELSALASAPPSAYRSAVLPPASVAATPTLRLDRAANPRIELADYEPDIEVFGERGIAVAEDLFCASSNAAVRILDDERHERYARKTVAPALMTAVGDAFMPAAGRSIWRDYATYWLDGNHGASGQWRQRFVAKADDLRARGVVVLAPDEALPAEAIEPVLTWRAASAAAAEKFRLTGDHPLRRPYELMFHFLHLMNNRLGLMPIEEAYFATLIAESLEAEVNA